MNMNWLLEVTSSHVSFKISNTKHGYTSTAKVPNGIDFWISNPYLNQKILIHNSIEHQNMVVMVPVYDSKLCYMYCHHEEKFIIVDCDASMNKLAHFRNVLCHSFLRTGLKIRQKGPNIFTASGKIHTDRRAPKKRWTAAAVHCF